MKYLYPTAFSCWGEEELEAIDRVLNSGQFTMGPEVAAFEAELATYHGRKHCVMVNSGSSANLVAVAALFHLSNRPLRAGMEAIVPAIAWSTTYAPLVQHGLQLILSDVDDTWNAADATENHDFRLVVACSVLGNPAHLAHWGELAGVHDAYMINDDCESLGASPPDPGDRDNTTASFGLMATQSFFYSHQISAIEGGAILTDDDECNELCRMLRAHGWSRDVHPPASFKDEYDFRLFGFNVRPLEMHAAIAREQLKKLPEFAKKRRHNLGLFTQQVLAEGLPILLFERNGTLSPFGLHFQVADGHARQRLVEALRRAGIDCRLPTGGSFTKHAYGARWRDQPTPNADAIHETGLFLGNGPIDLSEEIALAVKVMKETL